MLKSKVGLDWMIIIIPCAINFQSRQTLLGEILTYQKFIAKIKQNSTNVFIISLYVFLCDSAAMAAGQLSCPMDPPAPDVGGVVGRRLVPRHLLLPHPQPPSPRCLSCPIIHVSKSCQEAALLAPDEPATQNSPIT